MCFKGMCYWLGQEQHKEILIYDWMEERFIRDMIILFDLGDEVFHAMLLPDSLYDPMVYCYNMRLLLWNESIALLGVHNTGSGHSTGRHLGLSFGIWVMDEFAWTKHVTFELSDEKPLTFLKSDEILMADAKGCLFSYNVGTKNLNYLPIQRVSNDSAPVVYVDSIVSLLGGNKLETGDNSINADFSLYKCSPFSYSIADKDRHSYSVWAIPPDDASLRIKKIWEAARHCSAHFGFYTEHRPRLSLLFGNLTIEERKKAQEKVSIMDESITSLSFPITRLALYKVNYKDTTLKSWEKIAEYPLLFN
ncbi:hypothetical protein M0R45_028555 [Rubus argutus]|uniref:Uncharacterized protein n=1 Tax=Rubus argutus TaxID=59490 RepID=A0AAW1W503_RUBAR